MTDLYLTTERFTLRPPTAEDVPEMAAFYRSERAQYAGGNLPRAAAWVAAAALLGHWQVRGFGLWAVTRTSDGALMGCVGPFAPDGWPEKEVGWLLLPQAEGQGAAFEATQAALEDARSRLGWQDIVHYIHENNTRSIALAERLGAHLDANAVSPKPDLPILIYRQPRKDAP